MLCNQMQRMAMGCKRGRVPPDFGVSLLDKNPKTGSILLAVVSAVEDDLKRTQGRANTTALFGLLYAQTGKKEARRDGNLIGLVGRFRTWDKPDVKNAASVLGILTRLVTASIAIIATACALTLETPTFGSISVFHPSERICDASAIELAA